MGDVERLRVHSWHINIGVGDGVIHLLVDEKGRLPATNGTKPLVKKAVLIDGGDSLHSLAQLKLTIAKIEAEYALPTEDGNQLKFDAILITHWDLDHWYGVHQLLREDLEATLNASPGYQALIENSNASWRKSIVTYQFTVITDQKEKLEALKTQTDIDSAYAALALTSSQKVQYTSQLLLMGSEKVPEAPWDLVETCFGDVVVRSKYLKYGNAYPGVARFVSNDAADKAVTQVSQDQILTSFYVPYQSQAGRIGPPPNKKGEESTRAAGTFFSSNADGVYILKGQRGGSDTSNKNWLTIEMPSTYQLQAPYIEELQSGKISLAAPNVEPEYVKDWRLLYCCKLYADFEDYLGAEIFHGTNGTSAWKTWKNPAGLLKAVNLTPAMGPRMFIVAGDQVVIGETLLAQASRAVKPIQKNTDLDTDVDKTKTKTDLTKSNTGEKKINTDEKKITVEGRFVKHEPSFHPFSRIIDTFSQDHLGVRYTGDFRNDSDDRNSASLICVILSSRIADWTTVTTKDQQRDSFQALYYTGGDALYDEEGAVASWLRDPDAQWNLQPMPAMKLSHHGASQSTPESLLAALHPMVMVISNPYDCTYAHPSPELLFYLDAYVADTTRGSDSSSSHIWRPPPLLCTNYPQYFDTSRKCDKMSLTAFRPLATITATTSEYRQFVNILLARYEGAGIAATNMWTALQLVCQAILSTMTSYKALSADQQTLFKNTVTGQIASRWHLLSPQDNTQDASIRATSTRAWITVVGGTTSDEDLEAHRIWRGDDVISQIYSRPAEPMVGEILSEVQADLPDGIVEATDVVFNNVTESTNVEAEEAGGIGGGIKRVREVSGEDDPGSKFHRSEVTETENGSTGFITSSAYDSFNSKPAPSSNPDSDGGGGGGGGVFHSKNLVANLTKMGSGQSHILQTNIQRREESPHAAATVTPVRSVRALAASNPSTRYTVYSKRFLTATGQAVTASASESSLEPGLLDDFVSQLSSGRLLLNTNLLASTSSSSPAPISLRPDDPWMSWLSAGSFSIAAFTLTGTVDTLARITSLDVSTTLFSSALGFSSAATAAAVGETPSITQTVAQAFLPKYQYLVLGLSGAIPPVTPSLSDILDTFGPSWLKGVGALPGFGSQLDFELDTTSGGRNLLFLKSYGDASKSMRLQFRATTPDQFSTSLGFMGSIALTNTYLVAKKRSTLQRADPGQPSRIDVTREIALQTTVTAKNGGKTVSFDAWFAFETDRTELTITFTNSGIVGDVIDWLIASCPSLNDSGIKVDDMLPKTKAVDIHQISLCLSNPGSPGKFGVRSASLILEVDAFGAPFQVRLNWPEFRLTALLWTDTPPTMQDYNLLMHPKYEAHKLLYPFGAQLSVGIPLMSLLSIRTPDPPHGIQPTLYEVQFTIERTPEKTISLSFSAVIGSAKPTTTSVPTIELGDLNLLATYTGASSQDPQRSSYDVRMSTSILLFPRNFDGVNPSIQAAELDVSVEIQDGSWTVIAQAINIQFAAIYDLFDSNAQESVMDILEQLTIPTLRVEYDYSQATKSHLSVAGTLRVHTLDLDLAYDYHSGGAWTFTAQLLTIDSSPGTPGEILLADLIKDFDPQSELAEHLADVPFIGQIGIPSVNAAAGAFEDAPVQLKLTKTTSGGAFVLWFRVEIDSPAGALSFLFVQYNAAGTSGPSGPSGAAGASPLPARPSPKRLLRVQLNNLPKLPQIPIVGNIDQPIDSIDYVFVQDSAGVVLQTAGKATGAGFTRAELVDINNTLPTGMQVEYRDTQSTLGSTAPAAGSTAPAAGSTPAYVLLQGHHFMVKAEGKLVLDHIFGAPQAAVTQSKVANEKNTSVLVVRPKSAANGREPPQGAAKAVSRTTSNGDSLTKQDSGTTMGSASRTLGPLTIHNVGVQVKDNHLFLVVDCTVLLGPVQLTLMGFGIGFPLKLDPPRKLSFNHLSDLQISDFKIELAGLDVYYNVPPVLIAGYFEHKDDPVKESFRGGLTVGIKAYVIMAVGAYEHTKQPVDFKSIFLFGRLDGPLLSLEFIEISGVEVGFAYNYDIRLPGPTEVVNFPLIHGPASSNNPMDLITSDPTSPTSFSNWQTTVDGKYWFALGMKADSFQIITADLAVLFAFGLNSLKIAIVGLASAALPPLEGQPPRDAFLYVELGIIAALDVFGGSVMVGGQLTPNSYVLSPDCHLTGAFAMCYWFGPSPYAGDWVFTVGGFHPAFKPPTYYPTAIPRVGIDWSLSSHLSIKGESFFAICPKACMGGGRLDANFSCGPVYANFTAYASFLVNFNKFFFIADMGVEVDCGFHADIGIIHINVSASISANLHIQGPPFGGAAYVDLWIHTFTIYFGDQDNAPDPIPWTDFLDQVRKPGPGSTEDSQLIVCAYVAGAATDTKQDPKTEQTPRETGDKWFVRAGSFEFRVECKFPMDKMVYGDGTVTVTANPPTNKTVTRNPIFSRLMDPADGQLASTVTVTIVDTDDTTPFSSPAADKDNQFLVTPVFRNLPKALWQQYDQAQDPVQSGNNISDILSSDVPSTITHLVGFNFESPNPKLPTFNLPVFNAAAAMEEGVFQDGLPKSRIDKSPVVPAGNVDERPILHPSAPIQSSDLPAVKAHNPDGTDADNVWTGLQTAWNSVGDNVVQAMTDSMTSFFGWATPSTQSIPAVPATSPPAPTASGVGVAGLPPRNLVGVKPAEVIKGLVVGVPPADITQAPNQYYLSAPCVSIAA